MLPPEKCKIFVIIFSFVSCFKKQVLFLLEVKEGGEWESFCFCFVFSVVCKKHHQIKNQGILPDSLIPQPAEIINLPNLGCILPL